MFHFETSVDYQQFEPETGKKSATSFHRISTFRTQNRSKTERATNHLKYKLKRIGLLSFVFGFVTRRA